MVWAGRWTGLERNRGGILRLVPDGVTCGIEMVMALETEGGLAMLDRELCGVLV